MPFSFSGMLKGEWAVAKVTTLEQRVMIQDMTQAGYSDPAIAEAVGCGLSTVRKWRRRAQELGRAGLASHMGRPRVGALGSKRPDIRGVLAALRQAHPGWGPATLVAELRRDPAFEGRQLPHRSSIARFLDEQQCTRRYERHHDLPQPQQDVARAPHDAWEMDARGYGRVPDVGVVSLINLNDRFTKLKLLSYPAILGELRADRHPDTEEYQMVLRLAFMDWGVPLQLWVDRDSIFYDNASKSPFPTRLHLWLLGLGVDFVIGPPDRPTVRAMTERSHQTWAWQALDGQCFAHWQALWGYLQERRTILNEWLPCETLGGVPPLTAHPEARIPRRLYRPEWEDQLLDLTRVHAYLQRGRWFRKASNVGTVSLGQQVYVLGQQWAHDEVEVTFNAQDQHLVFCVPDGPKTKRVPIKGITTSALIGPRGPFARMQGVQLVLPLTWGEWQLTHRCTQQPLLETGAMLHPAA